MKECPTCHRELKDNLQYCPFDGDLLVAEADPEKLIGTLIDDKYRVEQKVGKGGMGSVYRATHIHIGSTVAVKILHPHLSSDATTLERFRREARSAAQIHHPNAVAVLDFGVTRDTGLAYLVMEFLEGVELRTKIKGKPLEYGEILNIMRQTCAAVQAAHSKGIIHRDLKPENIWLLTDQDGFQRVKVLDFGIAKLKGDGTLTQAGMIIGTPYYMSPEQCVGAELDARSDIYSLGIILYEMLTGQLPFTAPTPMGIVVKHMNDRPRPPSEVRPGIPPEVEAVVMRALSKQREERQESATALAADLEAAMTTAGLTGNTAARVTADRPGPDSAGTGQTNSPTIPQPGETTKDISGGWSAPRRIETPPPVETPRRADSMATASLLHSQVGEYRLVDFLGAGGMGEVYRGVHMKIGRVVAVKVLSRAEKQPGLVDRFLNEARIQSSLHHPNIATLFDFQEVNGNRCIIMEYIDGQNLDDRIRSFGCLPLSEAVFVFQAVVDALSYMHANNVIHRDIKSNNIKISSTGQVKLLDFGIAKAGATPSFTVAGDVVGTLHYLSPEQLKGGIADTRSDVWALGILLYELATGHVPFEATTIGGLYEKIMKGDYSSPRIYNPALPREIESIISRCLKKNPSDRYQSAQALRGDVMNLARVVSTPRLSSPSLDQSSGGCEGGLSGALGRPGVLIAVAAASLGAILLVVFLVVSYMSPSPLPENDNRSNNSGIASSLSTPTPGYSSTPTAAKKTVHFDVAEGHAEVYINDKQIGSTPIDYSANIGDHLQVVLKQHGYKDRVVPPITVDPTAGSKPYMFTMEKDQ